MCAWTADQALEALRGWQSARRGHAMPPTAAASPEWREGFSMFAADAATRISPPAATLRELPDEQPGNRGAPIRDGGNRGDGRWIWRSG